MMMMLNFFQQIQYTTQRQILLWSFQVRINNDYEADHISHSQKSYGYLTITGRRL